MDDTYNIYEALVVMNAVAHFVNEINEDPDLVQSNGEAGDEDFPQSVSLHNWNGEITLMLTVEGPERFIVKSKYDEQGKAFTHPLRAIEAFKERYNHLRRMSETAMKNPIKKNL